MAGSELPLGAVPLVIGDLAAPPPLGDPARLIVVGGQVISNKIAN
ncbi:hypothetical protein [Microtetraspora malaysiensis]|uniref:Uncharacterized protein n=1 Tax=Microtetraspora malaysiensis TaxID=161358 RepID=A0ABW6T2L1_9ACTN